MNLCSKIVSYYLRTELNEQFWLLSNATQLNKTVNEKLKDYTIHE